MDNESIPQRPIWPEPTHLGQEELFALGVKAFNARDFYEAHDYWEELWTRFALADKHFVQGLIQLAVGCFHLTNDNVNGGRGLFGKCLAKFDGSDPQQRGLDVSQITHFIATSQVQLQRLTDAAAFDWSDIPILQLPHDPTDGDSA